MAFKIYTKTGDKGKTSLFGGARLSKSHIRIASYGNVDELNAHVGLLHDICVNPEHKEILIEIQNHLFSIGSNLAMDPNKSKDLVSIKGDNIIFLENQIDLLEQTLPPLANFILPSGHPTVSQCHIVRTVCRRAERGVVALAENDIVNPIVIQFLNRLSDYLFVLSRKLGQELGAKEHIWKPSI